MADGLEQSVTNSFILMSRPLPIELTAHTNSTGLVFRIVHQQAHEVGNNTDHKAVDLCHTGNHFRAVTLLYSLEFTLYQRVGQ